MNPFAALLLSVILVVPFWKICSKAGYSGWLSLLILVPIANLILLYFLAFSEWPSRRDGISIDTSPGQDKLPPPE